MGVPTYEQSTYKTLKAGENLTGKVGYGVKLDSDTVKVATVAGTTYGVLQSDGESGEAVNVCVDGPCMFYCAETSTTRGVEYACHTDGTWVLADATGQLPEIVCHSIPTATQLEFGIYHQYRVVVP